MTESWIARTPLRNHKVLALPAMLPTWRMPDSGDPDWMLVSSHLFAHHVRTTRAHAEVRLRAHPRPLHLGARARPPRQLARGARGQRMLKPIDRRRAAEATSIAVNSRFTGERVRTRMAPALDG